jgi:type III secretory pathway component EscS
VELSRAVLGATTFQLGAFLPQLGSLLLLFLLAASVLPDEIPAEGLSLAEHYDARRIMIWGLLLAYIASAVGLYVVGLVDDGTSLQNALRRNGAGLAFLLVIAVPLFVRRRWVAAVVLGLTLVVFLASWLGRQIG